MKGIEIGLVVGTAVSLVAGGFLLVSNREQAAQMNALERELEVLRGRQEAQTARSASAVPSPAEARPPGTLQDESGVAASDLADQVVALSTTVKMLEQTAETLDSRITRSRLAVPSDEERNAQIARGEARLQELRKTADAAQEKARQVATSLKMPFDEKRLLEAGANAALEEKAEFVQARDSAAAKARVVEIFEKKLAELQFSAVVEGLPPDAER